MRAWIYDRAILRLTTRWYHEVLSRQPVGAHVLDVGVGPAGALVANRALLNERDLRVTGIDIDADYVRAARARVADAGLGARVQVVHQPLLAHEGAAYQAVYFAASFMLMPDPPAALRHAVGLLAPGGAVWFTQTFQERRSALAERTKPILKRLTTIDFGQVTYEDDFRRTLVAGGVDLTELSVIGTAPGVSYRLAVASPALAAPAV